MALEAADMNDNEILEQTRQVSDGKGNIQFKITLADGHTLNSEWISPDNKKRALFSWIEVVKQTAAARSSEREEEIKAQIRRQRDADQAKKGLIDLPPGIVREEIVERPSTGGTAQRERAAYSGASGQVPEARGGRESPLQYVLARAEQARREALMWDRIASELTAAGVV